MRGLEIERREKAEEEERLSAVTIGRGGGSADSSEKRPRASERSEAAILPVERERREIVHEQGREYHVRDSEVRSLYEIGRFHVISEADLAEGAYGGNRSRMQSDLRGLREQNLIRRFPVVSRKASEKLHLVVLTKDGKRLVEKRRPGGAHDRVYQGFVKPAEAVHDAMLYRMFRHEEQRIEAEGGRVRGVALDYELKGRVYSDIAKAWHSRSADDYFRHHAEAAQRHQLPVIEGRIAFPDVRVEYEDAAGELRRVDLELATENYRPGHIAAKVNAGFRLYVPGALLSGRLRGSFAHDREITAGIFAL